MQFTAEKNALTARRGGETLRALGCFSEPGGKGFNQAIAARKAGGFRFPEGPETAGG